MWFTLYERSNEGARRGADPATAATRCHLLGYDCGKGEHREDREHDVRAVRRALEDGRREIRCRCA